ncbi:MAG: hypothetical protein ACRDMZ_12390 [Solirubrobacteraceae bacterium]
MPIVAAAVLLGCLALMLMILRRRQGVVERPVDRDPQLDEALERVVAWLRRPRVVVIGAALAALVLIAGMARNPSSWALLLLALAVLATAVAAYVVRGRLRDGDRGGWLRRRPPGR